MSTNNDVRPRVSTIILPVGFFDQLEKLLEGINFHELHTTLKVALISYCWLVAENLSNGKMAEFERSRIRKGFLVPILQVALLKTLSKIT